VTIIRAAKILFFDFVVFIVRGIIDTIESMSPLPLFFTKAQNNTSP